MTDDQRTKRAVGVHIEVGKESKWPAIIIFGIAALVALGFGLYIRNPDWFSWFFRLFGH